MDQSIPLASRISCTVALPRPCRTRRRRGRRGRGRAASRTPCLGAGGGRLHGTPAAQLEVAVHEHPEMELFPAQPDVLADLAASHVLDHVRPVRRLQRGAGRGDEPGVGAADSRVASLVGAPVWAPTDGAPTDGRSSQAFQLVDPWHASNVSPETAEDPDSLSGHSFIAGQGVDEVSPHGLIHSVEYCGPREFTPYWRFARLVERPNVRSVHQAHAPPPEGCRCGVARLDAEHAPRSLWGRRRLANR